MKERRFFEQIPVLFFVILLYGCAVRTSEAPVCDAPEQVQDTAETPQELTDRMTAALLAAEPGLTLRVPFHGAELIGDTVEAARSRSVLTRTGLSALDWSWSDGVLQCRFTYLADAELLRREKSELALYAAEFASSAADFSPQAKVLLAHDRLLRECEYTAGAPRGDAAAGALLLHSAECGGYAEGFALLCEFSGLPCMTVTGTADSIPHAWNLVQLDGAWYHVDCAWDDAERVDAHAYFLCDDAAMQQTHRWDAAAYPAAQGGSFCYASVIAEMSAVRE